MKDIRKKYKGSNVHVVQCENIGTESNSGRGDMNGYLVPIGQRCIQWTWKSCNHMLHMLKHVLVMIVKFCISAAHLPSVSFWTPETSS